VPGGQWKRFGAALVIASSPGLFTLASCVDGTTPDCSDAATRCGPVLDEARAPLEAALPDTARPDTATPDAAPPDADAAGLDAGDEG
jgi:hypothetical protein